MKKISITLILLVAGVNFLLAQNANYDPELAQMLNADEYGIRLYTLVFLKTSEKQNYSEHEKDSIFRGHLNNISRFENESKLFVAGPFGANPYGYRGLFIFYETDIKKVEEMVNTDPAVSSGILKPEIFNWYDSAALPIYLDYHNKIWIKMP
ncbi:MAG TPA: hypothetical protein ENN49_06005 [Bacteroidales bacterium]|nr:hypothetical protein [Bacteroidales bacterium]